MSEQVPSEQFAIGEIVILAVAIVDPAKIGEEREIMGLPAPYKQLSWTGRWYGPGSYSLRNPDGTGSQAYPWQLRRRKRPDEVGTLQREAETT